MAEQDKTIQLLTHQAKNLEQIKLDATWMRGRVESIDQLLTDSLGELRTETIKLRRIVGRIEGWIVFWSIMALIGALLSAM